jgi:para-nitrobenzyl esterase
VLFFINGGGYSAGSGGEVLYDGRALAEATRMVVVTINYRLGAFGFLSHSKLSTESADHPTSGNYGMEDQRAALKWVRDNIAGFGGNPGNITIYGESAGAGAVCWHVASPLSNGMFHRAVISSGSCVLLVQDKEKSQRQGERFATDLGCGGTDDVLECLRSKSVGEVVAKGQLKPGDLTSGTAWGPVIDGVEVPKHPQHMLDEGSFNRVPILTGATKDEGTLFVGAVPDTLTEEQYKQRVQSLFPVPELAAKVLQAYPASAYASPKKALIEVFTDSAMACPVRRVARSIARAGVPTYHYSFAYPAEYPELPPNLGIFHASELAFVFGNPVRGLRLTGDNQTMSRTLMGYWANFASQGNPNGSGLPAWPGYTDQEDATLSLEAQPRIVHGLKKDNCELWNSLGP